jgi:hypothetical protein
VRRAGGTTSPHDDGRDRGGSRPARASASRSPRATSWSARLLDLSRVQAWKAATSWTWSTGRSEARAIRQRRWRSAAAVMAWLRRAAVDRAQTPASGAGPEIESRRSDDRRSAMHLPPRRGLWVQSGFCRCRSWTVATVPRSPRVWTRTRPRAISLTVLTDVRRSHLQHRLGSPFLPDLFGPRDATVHL